MSARRSPIWVADRRTERGQAMVEFALTLIVFILLLMGVFDLGRGIFMYNGVSEAAREVARVTSVHPGVMLGDSPETQAVIDQQQSVVPGLGDPEFSCVDIAGDPVVGTCLGGDWVKVQIEAPFTPVTPPLIPLIGTRNLTSTSSIQIP